MLLGLVAITLGACTAESPSFDRDKFDPAINAEFRAYARGFLLEINPSCEPTVHPASLAKIEKFKRDWSKLKQEQSATLFAVEIQISEADSKFEVANRGVAECQIPDTDGSDSYLQDALFKMETSMIELRRIASGKPKEYKEIGSFGN